MAEIPLPTGQKYGDRQRLENFQRSGPMFPEPPPEPAGAGSAMPPPAGAPIALDPFGRTQRPDEPITAGVPVGPGPSQPGMLPKDDHLRFRAAYAAAVANGWDGAAELAEMIDQAG